MEVIAAQNITKQYPTGHGIQNISFSIENGQCFGVLGANGSGKTTLTRLVAGLDRIQQGNLSVLGDSAFPRSVKLRRRYGVAMDNPAHWETLTGRQNLTFFANQFGLYGDTLKQRIYEYLSDADLTAQADDPIAAYSFGMRRKLNIIEAMVHDPDLLILDEPSAGVDVAFQEQLAQWIYQRCQKGKTTWIADNDAEWLAKAATDAVLLSQGQIVSGGCVKELMESIDARYRITVELAHDVEITEPTVEGIIHFQHNDRQITADMNSDPHLPARLLEWITDSGGQVRTMEVRSITLHQALQQRAGQKEAVV